MDFLKSDRVEIFHADKGYEAIKLCQQQSFDLLITDLVVEGINGFELVNYVNSSSLKQKPEIIVISGAFEDGVKNYINQLDVKNCFDKPFDMGKFQNKVNSLLYIKSTCPYENIATIMVMLTMCGYYETSILTNFSSLISTKLLAVDLFLK